MHIQSYTLRVLTPPKDDVRQAIKSSRLRLREGAIVAISSKAVSIDEGACIPIKGTKKIALITREAEWYRHIPHARHKKYFTIARGVITGSAGIDESNGNGHYVLYPKDPFKSAQRLRVWLQKTYGVQNVAVVITDSKSETLRRGAIGFALAWDGIDPLHDYRGEKDLFGRPMRIELANVIDALAASAVLVMGEVAERKPLVVMRGVPNIVFKNRSARLDQLIVAPTDDLFAPVLFNPRWKRGGNGRAR
ncbi:putative folate metabolism gamma-glutamate ligase [Candidatus Kaiserbacteria bacterium CG10_big_fil_rev_8_21_14_0_10_56_12]|uniref:Putative folate metabolism gamma-glutamate ligase n=1 Tax=Candidatus Kaiserbacteria bacterium CG10_big_fil_rev_8_21_14_0_10_56_12 TaxID=1974611 RepID=A0A2H0U9S5_9BACT|nr:MAG: putative folate metabolism gamma-glutamate ligase [Candidatus Kaiserbacteria bacterium CG10_big_fil_rev_8_21_14_0_10_56_12]